MKREKELITTVYHADEKKVQFLDFRYNPDEKKWDSKVTREYIPGMASNLVGFLLFWVKNQNFTLKVKGQEFKVSVYFNGGDYTAITDNYDGPEDRINLGHGNTRGEAFEALIDQLSEAIMEERI